MFETKRNILIQYLIFAVFLVLMLTFTFVTYPQWLTSDMSAELIAAKQAFNEGHLLSPNWYYGTELRLLTPTLIYQFLFLFASDFYTIRVVSIIIVLIILFASLFFLLRQAGYQKFFPLVGTCLLLPFGINSAYFIHVISGYQMYAFYIALMFLTIGLFFYYNRHQDRLRRIIAVSLIASIAIICGINGPRHLVILYVPLLLAALIIFLINYLRYQQDDNHHYRNLMLMSGIALIANGIGLSIYFTVMKNNFHFFGYDISFAPSWDRFKNVFMMLGECLGFNHPTDTFGVFSNITFACAFIFLIVFLIGLSFFYKKFNYIEQLLSIFFISGVLLMSATLFFFKIGVDNDYFLSFPQYLIFNLIFGFFLVPILIKHYRLPIINEKTNSIIKTSFVAFFLAIASTSFSVFFGYGQSTYRYKYTAPKLIDIASFIEEKDYTFGYASHWNGAIMNELTHQKVDMYVWKLDGDKLTINPEVQSTSHDNFIRDEKCFAIFSIGEHSLKACTNARLYGTLIYENQYYRVYDLATAKILNYE